MMKPFGRITSCNASQLWPALNAGLFFGQLELSRSRLLHLTEVSGNHYLEIKKNEKKNEIMWRM